MGSWSSWQVFSLLCFITLISTTDCHIFSHVYARSVNGPGAQSFVDSLFEKYGKNKSMDLKQFEALLKELKVGSMQAAESGHGHHESHHESESESSHGHHDKEEKGSDKCYSAEVLFDSFSIESNRLNQTSFERICPAIVQQIESKSCESGKEDSGDESESKAKAWGFGFLSVTIISSASLLGAFIVPFMNKSFYKILLLFMVSLAVGVLSGSGIIHLIPHAFGFHAHDGELGYLWKCLVIIGGIYSFFFLEYVMRMIVRFKEQSTCDNHDENEMDNTTGDIPAAGIADVQLQLYKKNRDHHSALHNHGASLPDVKICGNGSTPNGFPNEASSQNSKKSHKKKKIAPVAWMIIIGDALHNFIDGLAIGASFSSSRYIGVSTSLAIFCEELPHELGDFAVLLNAGLSYKAALAFNFLSACTCYLGLVIGLLLGYTTSAVTWIYALAGGLFVYIALVDMLPEACEMSAKIGERSIRRNIKAFALQNFGILLGFAIMLILALYGETISVK
ncbi:unnamed protein product [Porites lobata]|uniref:Zinc transporter ZIP4/12 EF-hand domain-containing protein n=1 Tax=Porites lobata TaxID=104759 RepID=A0ABN8SDS6_9CNID|nr:unnamed protein product [Porites lobata]